MKREIPPYPDAATYEEHEANRDFYVERMRYHSGLAEKHWRQAALLWKCAAACLVVAVFAQIMAALT